MQDETTQDQTQPSAVDASVPDLPPDGDVKGGLLPAVQKVRDAAFRP